MIVILKERTPTDGIAAMLDTMRTRGISACHVPNASCLVLEAKGRERELEALGLPSHPAVHEIRTITTAWRLVSRAFRREDTIVDVGGVSVGGEHVRVIAGPCAIESQGQLRDTATRVRRAGASLLRGGAHKPRTSPYSFQGLCGEGLRFGREISRETGLPFVSEVVDARDVPAFEEHVDCIQVGARNMQNFELLKAVGRSKRPVLLKRGLSAKVEELLLAAEYVVAEGNPNVILCERGIRTFETATRNTLDLAIVAFLREATHLPVIVDPSHGTGRRSLVGPMAKAAIACGAHGVMIEVHPDPDRALSDGPQSLTCEQFEQLMVELRPFVAAAGKEM